MSVARLEELRQLVAEHGSAELLAWLEAGLACRGRGESLERALELSAQNAAVERDAALRQAAYLIDPDGKRKPWQRAGDLATLVRRFRWERYRSRQCDLSPLQQAVFEAYRANEAGGLKMPTSQRQIARLIDDKSIDRCQ